MLPDPSEALPQPYVLSLSRDSVCVEFATRLVADSGIAVVRVEPATGEPLRNRPALFAYLTAGKQTRALDLGSAAGTVALEALVAGACAVAVDEWGRDQLHAQAGRPGVVLVGARDSTVLRDIAGQPAIREFLAFHASGLGFITPRMMPGFPSAAPLCPDARLSTLMIGIYGAIALLATMVGRRRGLGAVASSIGVVAAMLPLLRREVASVDYDGTVPHRNERIWKVSPAEVHRCRDGWVFVDIIEDVQWVALCGYMRLPELADDPLYNTRDLRFEHADELCVILDQFFAAMPQDCWIEAQAKGIPIAPVNAPADLIKDEQLLARGFWQDDVGAVRRIPRSPLRSFDGRSPADAGSVSDLANGKPLAGLRVIELTHVWSGPLCGQILADLGAEVIRVENAGRLDIHRRSGPFAGGVTGVNRSGTWNAQNRGKRACTLDLKAPEGRDALLKLVRDSDVLVENFTPGTIDRLGLGLADLRAVNSDMVLLSLSGFGQDGPHRQAMAYGPMMDAATGISALTTYADGVPRAVNGWAADVGGALYGCAAVLRALLDVPGKAVHLDVSQFESGVLFALEALLESAGGAAAAEVYDFVVACAEREAWVAISAHSDGEIVALRQLLGYSEAGELSELAQGWAKEKPRPVVLAQLRMAGVPAVAVQTVPELMADIGLAEGGAWIETVHAEVGAMRSYGPPIRLAGLPPDTRPAPCMGQDNDYVFGVVLGFSDSKIHDFKARRII